MSSHLYAFDGLFHHHSIPDVVAPDGDLFFPDPSSCFSDSAIDILRELSNSQETEIPVQNSSPIEIFSSSILSSSPPTHQLENLTLYRSTIMQPPEKSSDYAHSLGLTNGYDNFSGLDALEVKNEENHFSWNSPSFVPHSYSGVENVANMMQRSCSSNSFDNNPSFFFQPSFDTVFEPPKYQNQALSSPENSFLAGHLRRVCSTGDLKNIKAAHPTQSSFSSPSAAETSITEESNFKVGRYSAEERKERISKYRAKRNQRNFTKTIKYACRKTLADNRPRIRGRFARNDETDEMSKAAYPARYEDEDELWFDGLHEEEDQGPVRGGGGGMLLGVGQAQLQYHSYGY